MLKLHKAACPDCSATTARYVSQRESRAVGRVSHVVCTECNASYVTRSWSIANTAVLLLALATLGYGGWWYVNGDQPRIAVVMLAIGLVQLAVARFVLLGRNRSTPVEVVPDDVGEASPRLRKWLDEKKSAGRQVGRALLRLAGVGFWAVGGLMGLLGGVIFFSHSPLGNGPIGGGGFLLFALVSVVVGIGLHGLGRSLAAPTAAEVLRADRRRPVLLLRSFADDHALLPTGNQIEQMVNPSRSFNTLEESAADVFAAVGPVVAVGRPGEKLPPSGAARVWLSDEQWQAYVLDMLEWSQRVIMILGSPLQHPGLEWEIKQVFRLLAPQKLLLVIPPHLGEETVRSRWQQYVSLAHGRMPPYQEGVVLIRYAHDFSTFVSRIEGLRRKDSQTQHRQLTTALAHARDWIESPGTFRVRCAEGSPQELNFEEFTQASRAANNRPRVCPNCNMVLSVEEARGMHCPVCQQQLN